MSMSFRLTAAVLLCIVVAACGHSPVPGSRPQQSQAAQAALPGVAPTHAPATSYPAAAPPQAQSGPLLADSTDGVHIEYNVYGHGEPAVVLIHGWACNASYWRAQLADLSSRYTTVTLDLAGHGASGSNRSDWSLARYGDDVAAVVRKLPNRQVVLVGHLMGGPVALEAAPLIGPRVIGIIGVDTFTSLGQPPLPRPVLEKEVAPFRADFIGEMHRFVPLLFTHNTDPAFVRKVADDMSRTSPPIAIATLLGLNSVDFATLLPHVHVPIIAIDSDTGQIVNEALVRKSVPRFRLVVVKGSGQFVMLEDPHRFNPILIRAIASLASSSR
ncbi:MAG TPA: alpha/beta hydrolase [Steroidobacteraceae bacterium]|nr:alpha/beta hydrolase [Steroidobacteraceae bacterium]